MSFRDDWLMRQIQQLAQFFRKLATAAHAEPHIDHELEGLTGMSLDVLRSLSPSMAVRLIGNRFGQYQPERVYAAYKVLDAAVQHGQAVESHRDALLQSLIDAVGLEGVVELEEALEGARDDQPASAAATP